MKRLVILMLLGGMTWAVGQDARLAPAQARSQPGGTMTEQDLDQLQGLGIFTLTVSAPAPVEMPDGRPALYVEAVYGDKGEDGWRAYSMLGANSQPLTLHTPKGDLVLTPNRLRLYLEAAHTKVFYPGDAAKAPDYLQSEVQDAEGPVTYEAYALFAGRTYHAKIDREGYYLPPEPGSRRPSKHYNTVLILSDQPFRDGKPVSPITPRSNSITY